MHEQELDRPHKATLPPPPPPPPLPPLPPFPSAVFTQNPFWIPAVDKDRKMERDQQQQQQQGVPNFVISLYKGNRCLWPDCGQRFDSMTSFIQHVDAVHGSSNALRAELVLQSQIVELLDYKTRRENEVLRGMVEYCFHRHFQNGIQQMDSTNTMPSFMDIINATSAMLNTSNLGQIVKAEILTNTTSSNNNNNNHHHHHINTFIPTNSQIVNSVELKDTQNMMDVKPDIKAIRIHRRSESSSASMLLPTQSGSQSKNYSYLEDIELARHSDEKPGLTYVQLIRLALDDSEHGQLTLSEIYEWISSNYKYFKKNTAAWKNAVRHNLSLHKCFYRMQSSKGWVWAVDNDEYNRRRSQRRMCSTTTDREQNTTHLSLDNLVNGGTIIAQQQQQSTLDVSSDMPRIQERFEIVANRSGSRRKLSDKQHPTNHPVT